MKRRYLLLPVVIVLIFVAWRQFGAPKDDRDIILGELEAIRTAAQDQNVNGILSRLDKDFRLGGGSKSEIRSQLTFFFFQNSDVRVDLSGLDVAVNGDEADSSGSYEVRWKSGAGAAEENKSGSFQARWRKVEGKWKITSVTGIDAVAAP